VGVHRSTAQIAQPHNLLLLLLLLLHQSRLSRCCCRTLLLLLPTKSHLMCFCKRPNPDHVVQPSPHALLAWQSRSHWQLRAEVTALKPIQNLLFLKHSLL
jgi:hypothetical protein